MLQSLWPDPIDAIELTADGFVDRGRRIVKQNAGTTAFQPIADDRAALTKQAASLVFVAPYLVESDPQMKKADDDQRAAWIEQRLAGIAALQVALMTGPRDPLLLGALWFALAFCGGAGPAAYAAIGQSFTPELAGRVGTAINASLLALVFVLQNAIGWILDLWPRTAAGGWDPAGYTWALVLTLTLQALAAVWLLVAPRARARARDASRRPGAAA